MKDIEIVVFNDKSWVRLTEYQKLVEENEQLGNEYNSLVIDHERLDYLYNQQIDEINDVFEENEQLKAKIKDILRKISEISEKCYEVEDIEIIISDLDNLAMEVEE